MMLTEGAGRPGSSEAVLAELFAPRAQAQADGVQRFISLEPRSRVLDLACGLGLQTLELARRGFRVLGIDPREAQLIEARGIAREQRLNAHFLNADPRQLSYRNEFDAVLSLGGSLAPLADDRALLRVLDGARKGLKNSGKLLFDMVNKEWLIRRLAAGPPAQDELRFDAETGRLECPGREPASLRLYTLTEFKTLLERGGLVYERTWGGYQGEPYGLESPRMIVLACLPVPDAPRKDKDADLVTAIRIKGRRKGK